MARNGVNPLETSDKATDCNDWWLLSLGGQGSGQGVGS